MFHPQALLEVIVAADQAIQFRVGVHVGQHHVDVVACFRDILLPHLVRCQVIPVRLILQVPREVEVLRIAAYPIQLDEAFRDSRNGRSSGNNVFPGIVCGERPHDIVGHDFRVRQGLGIPRRAIVPHQRQIEVLLLVENPVNHVLIVVRLDVPESHVSIRIAGGPHLIHNVLRSLGDFRVARVLSKQAAGVQDLADPVIHITDITTVRTVPELVQPVTVQVEHHVVLVSQVHDAAVDFAARQFLVSEPFRNELVRNNGFDDIPFARCQCVCPATSVTMMSS